jgi:hypothetical protein
LGQATGLGIFGSAITRDPRQECPVRWRNHLATLPRVEWSRREIVVRTEVAMGTSVRRILRVVFAITLLVGVVGAASGCGESKSSSGTTSRPATGPGSKGNEPNKNASEENTPSVGPNGSVEVDDLRWRLIHAETTHTIGEPESPVKATANGVFVLTTLHVTNKKHETVTMTSEVVALNAEKKEYKPSTEADTALTGQGGKTFLIQELTPEESLEGKAAFDVPPQVLNEHPQLRFKELGVGSSHGFIALPPLHA